MNTETTNTTIQDNPMSRKERVKQLRQKLAHLTDAEKANLQTLCQSRGLVATVEGRKLSLNNTILVYHQSMSETIPSIVGGFRQWQAAGRYVRKGEHGMLIWFPIGKKNEDGDIDAAERFYTTTVFDISQTEPQEKVA